MRILHVGNGNEKHLGRRTYDVGRKLQHGLIRNEHDALFFSDRDRARTGGRLGTKWHGPQNANRQLLETAKNFQPDMVLLGHADIITNETLMELRTTQPDIKIAQFNVDPLFRPENHQAILVRVPYVDATFITTAGEVLSRYRAPHHRVSFIPNPVDSAIETMRAHENTAPDYDVFYAVRAATMQQADTSDRLRLPRYVKTQLPELRTAYFGFDGAPELFGAAYYQTLGKCAMGLNLSHKHTTKGAYITATDAEKHGYSSDRIAQYMGCGLLTFAEHGFGLDAVFNPDEIVLFSGENELTDKLRYYMQHPKERMSLAKNGWNAVHTRHNAALVAQYIVEVTCTLPYSNTYEWDITLY